MKLTWFKRRKLSDVELVEQTRKFLPMNRRAKWVHLCLGIGLLVMFAVAAAYLTNWLEMQRLTIETLDESAARQRGESSFETGYSWGLMGGMGVGFVLAYLLFKAWHFSMMFAYLLGQERKDTLLVAFWDELKTRQAGRDIGAGK